jgi:hypothetical protein
MEIVKYILLLVFCFSFLSSVGAMKNLYVIDIGYLQPDVTLAEKLAVLSCQGLMNRKSGEDTLEETAVYTIKESWDQEWLDTTLEYDPFWILFPLTIEEFLSDVCERENFPKIMYSKSTHHEVIPQIITVAGVLSAVPLDTDSGMDEIPSWIEHAVAFDAGTEFANFTEYEATNYVYTNFVHLTTGVSMMNPGWKALDNLHPVQHELVGDPDVGLADFIIKERIFNFFLWSGCVPSTKQHKLMREMMNDETTSWNKPVEVYGYNNAVVLFGGDLFEAETNCIKEHNMGQIASSGVNNYSFFNKKSSIETPEDLEKYLAVLLKTRKEIEEGTLIFDPAKTYITFVVGDGDNTAFMKGGRRGWMKERIQHCNETVHCNFPLSWSISPHLLYLAPDWLYWYYDQANQTQQDVFVLPPSGHLYSYPGMMNGTIQDNFVKSTQEDCRLLSATGSVHWEWFFGWEKDFDNYFPKYATPKVKDNSNIDELQEPNDERHEGIQENGNCVKSFFATNVPYNLPTPIQWKWNEHFRIVDDDIVVFKPREWRGTNKDNAPIFAAHNYLTEEEMAAEINGYEKGSVAHLYLTSDGGMNLDTLYKMVDMLNDDVKIVNHEELTEMAVQKGADRKLK